jgi:Zn-dependent protease/CBS domain-containing protein
MFGKAFNLFRLFGFQVRADASWLLLAFLITWTLASGLFPVLYAGLSPGTYWFMGLLGAAGLLLSIVAHEMSHAVVARQYGLPIKNITLFLFGGVAEMEDEPVRPAAEFWMAVAGPVASVLVGLAMWFLAFVGGRSDWPVWLNGTLAYLGGINLLLAVFNMVPAFPLDGGRVLRSALWGWKSNLKWATRISSHIGSGFALFLIVLGVVSFVTGNFIGGMWWFLIGMFLRHAARMSYRQLMIRRALEGEPVRRFMQREVHSVPPQATLAEFVEDYVYRHHHKLFPVQQNGTLLGCVSTRRLRGVPREDWDSRTVDQLIEECSAENVTSPDADAMKTLMRMSRTGHSRLMVVENGHLIGILTLKDLSQFISLKLEIEEDGEGEPSGFLPA